MTTLREAAQAVLDQWEGWEPMPGECEELALSFDKLAEALATPEPDGKDAALLRWLEGCCVCPYTDCPACEAAARIRALLSERDRLQADLARANARAEAWKRAAEELEARITSGEGLTWRWEMPTDRLAAARALDSPTVGTKDGE